MKKAVKKIIPYFILQIYHWLLSRLAALLYIWPSRKLIVIGVTGTSGKSTTSEVIDAILSIKFKTGSKEWLNDKKMTMIGRFQLQKLLRQMVRNGCDYAVVETTSEGVRQFRHLGIHYDVLVFTNLYPEHIDSHGSFENYKQAKLKLFRHLERLPRKKLPGVGQRVIKKVIIANINDKHAADFLDFEVDEKHAFGLQVQNI